MLLQLSRVDFPIPPIPSDKSGDNEPLVARLQSRCILLLVVDWMAM